MEKKLFLAFSLSLLVLLAWSSFVSKPVNKQQASIPAEQALKSELPAAQTSQSIEVQAPTQSEFEFSSGKSKILFIEPQAAIKEVIFGNYQSSRFELKRSLLIGEKSWGYVRQDIGNKQVSYTYSDSEKVITKKISFDNSNYSIYLELKVQNTSTSPLSLNIPLILGALDLSSKQSRLSYQDISVNDGEKTTYPNIKKDGIFTTLKFIGLRDRYFCAIIEPEEKTYSGLIKKLPSGETEVSIISPELKIAPGQEIKQNFHMYLGPQDLKLIKSANPAWQSVIYFGKFDIIAQILLKMLEFSYKITRNWGWAIIILSLAIYLILYPLTLKQMRSMKEMQLLQPQIKELQAQYKDNTQRLNKETMELYRKHKVNPLGGCLPMVLQVPIFFALYQVLTRSIALKGSGFLWIKDLSDTDKLFPFPVEIPFLGKDFNVLPVLMAIGMFFQQKSSMSNMGSGSQEQQKMMQILFPIMFGVIFYQMPSGLVLYWFINSALTLIYQLKISKSK
jgi:YidC/Oxa1 family membrane protein insertase